MVWFGTQAQYNAIAASGDVITNCLYFITDEGDINGTEWVSVTAFNTGVSGEMKFRRFGKQVSCNIDITYTSGAGQNQSFMPLSLAEVDFPDGFKPTSDVEQRGLAHVSEYGSSPQFNTNYGASLVTVSNSGMSISGFGGMGADKTLHFVGAVNYSL